MASTASTPVRETGEVYEYTWNGSSWVKVLVGDTIDTRNVKLGRSRNDGRFRVYTASGDSNAYEYTGRARRGKPCQWGTPVSEVSRCTPIRRWPGATGWSGSTSHPRPVSMSLSVGP